MRDCRIAIRGTVIQVRDEDLQEGKAIVLMVKDQECEFSLEEHPEDKGNDYLRALLLDIVRA